MFQLCLHGCVCPSSLNNLCVRPSAVLPECGPAASVTPCPPCCCSASAIFSLILSFELISFCVCFCAASKKNIRPELIVFSYVFRGIPLPLPLPNIPNPSTFSLLIQDQWSIPRTLEYPYVFVFLFPSIYQMGNAAHFAITIHMQQFLCFNFCV